MTPNPGDHGLTQAAFELLTGAQPRARLPLAATTTTIGRAPGNTHVVNDQAISRQHAKIFLRDGRHWIADLNSSHGTFVNGVKVTLQTLVDGDEVKLGGTVLRYVESGRPAPQAARPPTPPDVGTGSFELELPEDAGPSKPASAPSHALHGPLPPVATGYRSALAPTGEDPFAEETSKKAVETPGAKAAGTAPAIELRGESARQFASRASGKPVVAAAAPSATTHVPPPLAQVARSRGPLAFLRAELDQRGAGVRAIAWLFALCAAAGIFWVVLRFFDGAPPAADGAPTDENGPTGPTGPSRPVLPKRH